jgi:hypothetical protein
MLLAYPREFRLEYGPEMTQVFRACHRDIESRGRWAAADFWLRTIVDVMRTAPTERWATFGKDSEIMKNLKRDLVAVLACLAIIVVALLLLNYGHEHEVAAIMFFGYALDALIVSGVISNLIIFLLVKTTRLVPLRAALWTLLIVHAALFLLATLIGLRVGGFSFVNVAIGYFVSFVFWLGLHWLWAHTKPAAEPVV